jgi:hypothetical protein
MEIVEWESEHVMGARIKDANADITGRVTFESLGPGTTRLDVEVDYPSLDASKVEHLRRLIERSSSTIRRLVESEV